MALAQPRDFRVVRPDDPPARRLFLLPGAHPLAANPALECRERHLARLRQLCDPPLSGAEAIAGRGLAPWGAQAQVAQELLDALPPEALPLFRRAVALGVEPRGDGFGGQPFAGQVPEPRAELGVVAELRQAGDRPDELADGLLVRA